MPATKTTFLLFFLPASVFAAGEITAAPAPVETDPRPMLLWYAVLGFAGLVSVVVGMLAISEHFTRKKERAQEREDIANLREREHLERQRVEALGGYVTYPKLLEELTKVYDAAKTGVHDGIKDLVEEVRLMRRTQSANVEDIAHIKGQLEGMPPPRRTRG